MDIRAIHTEADLDWALAEVEPYFENEPELGTAAGERFEILTTLIEVYENKHWAIPTNVDPIAVIEHAITHLGKTRKELTDILGSSGRTSEILRKQRALSIEMIRAISKAWELPVELLIQPYKLKRKITAKAASTPPRKPKRAKAAKVSRTKRAA